MKTFGIEHLPPDLPSLLSLWRKREPEQWAKRPGLYSEVGRRILERGESLLAYDVFQEGMTASPDNIVIVRLMALSLARSGAPHRACELLTGLHRRGCRDKYKHVQRVAPEGGTRQWRL